MKRDVLAVITLTLAVLCVLCLVAIGFALALGAAPQLKDAVAVFQGLVAVAAVVLGALFAYRNSLLFRTFEPHLTVTQSVSSRAVGTQYLHISVITTLHNSSKVKVEIRRGFFRIHQIQPINDEDVEHLYNQAFNPDAPSDINWPVLDEIHREFGPNELVVEPGASHHEPCEFIMPKAVTTVLVYSYFHNQAHSKGSQSAQGWTATTFYDVSQRGNYSSR